MQKIAITGNMGTGKSVVGDFLRENGETVLEADELTRELYRSDEIRVLIEDYFGLGYFYSDGRVNKRKLAVRVFREEKDRRFLERIFWPRLREQVELWLYKQSCRQKMRVFVIVPLLFEAGWQKMFEEIWLVTARRAEILARLQAREKISLAEAQARLMTQIPDREKLSQVQVVLKNNDEIGQLKQALQQVLQRLDK